MLHDSNIVQKGNLLLIFFLFLLKILYKIMMKKVKNLHNKFRFYLKIIFFSKLFLMKKYLLYFKVVLKLSKMSLI